VSQVHITSRSSSFATLADVKVFINDKLCGIFPSTITRSTTYTFDCDMVGTYIKLKTTPKKYMGISEVSVDELDITQTIGGSIVKVNNILCGSLPNLIINNRWYEVLCRCATPITGTEVSVTSGQGRSLAISEIEVWAKDDN
jgi:hypothetical protein